MYIWFHLNENLFLNGKIYHILDNITPEHLHIIIHIRPCRISVEITFSPLQVSVTILLAEPFSCCKKKKKADLKSLQTLVFSKWMLMPALLIVVVKDLYNSSSSDTQCSLTYYTFNREHAVHTLPLKVNSSK